MKTLERRLGLSSVVLLSVSATLGVGVFVIPGLAIGKSGGSTYLAFLLCGLCVLSPAMSKAELASAMPYSGGTYNYILKAFGPFMGTVMGLGLWSSLLLKSCFALLGIGAYLRVLGHGIPLVPVALGMLAIITMLNLTGIKKVSKFQNVIVAISLVGLLTLCLKAIPALRAENFEPLLPHGPTGFFETAAFLFVAFSGVTKVAAIAGEVKDPGKNLPRAMLLTMAIVTPIYMVTAYILAGTLNHDALGEDIRPIYTLAVEVGGPIFGYAAAVIAVLCIMSMANAGLLASSRFPFALSRDSLLPPALSHVHHRYLTPSRCIILTATTMGLIILFVDIDRIIKLASAFKILAFMANEVSLIIIRTSRPHWYKPAFLAPLFPGLQIIAALTMLGLLISLGPPAIACVVLAFTCGGAIFFFYGRHHMKDKGVIGKVGLRFDLAQAPEELEEALKSQAKPTNGDHTAIVALTGAERSVEMLALVGAALSNKQRIEVVHISEVPDQLALDEMLEEDADVVSIRRRVLSMRELVKLNIKFEAMVSHDVIGTVHSLASDRQCEWMVMKWRPYRFFNPLGWLYNHLPTDLALYRDRGIRYIRRILILAEPGPLDAVLAESADSFSRHFRGTLTFASYVPSDASRGLVQQKINYLQDIRGLAEVESEQLLLRGNNEIETITEASKSYDLLVMAARPHSTLRNIFLQTTEDTLVDRSVCSVVLLKSPRLSARAKPEIPAEVQFPELLRESLIGVGLTVTNKVELFERIAEQFLLACPTAHKDDVVMALVNREAAQNTGVCQGVAMPHATLPDIYDTFLMIEVLATPLDYDAPDNQPVDVVFATVGPPLHRETHLKVLGALSRMVLEASFLDELRAKQNSKQVIELITKNLK